MANRGFSIRVRNSVPKFEFFLFGLGLGYVMVCDVTLVCVQVRSVVLIKELAQGVDRKGSLVNERKLKK